MEWARKGNRDDPVLFEAILRNLEVIGEAVKHVPGKIQALDQEIPWKMFARFRDVLTHAYFRIDPNEVWNIVDAELPDLLDRINVLRRRLDAIRED